MENFFAILCLSCIVKFGVVLSADAKPKDEPRVRDSVPDLEGSETSAKLFLGSLFPSYGSNPSYRPGGYPSTGGGYYPSSSGGGFYPTYNPSQGYYPNTGYYPTGTNILGNGYGGYPTQSNYPSYGYSRTSGYNTRAGGYDGSYSGYGGSSGNRGSSGFGGSSSYGGSRSYAGYGGYGGYGGNGGLTSYNGYYNPQYSGKRNLGFGYYSDTDRYGFYQSPSQHLSVHRGYN